MKLKKVLLQIGLLLVFVGVGIGFSSRVMAAVPSGVDSDAQPLSGSSFAYTRDSANLVPDKDNEGGVYGVTHYPQLNSTVWANGVINGRLTRNTTKVWMLFSAPYDGETFTIKNGYFTKVYADISYSLNNTAYSVVTNSVASWITGEQKTVTRYPTKWAELDVDLSGLGSTIPLPLYLGFSYDYGSARIQRYYTTELTADVPASMLAVTIDGNGSVSSSATKIEGNAQSGLTVALMDSNGNALTDSNGKPYTVTADSNNRYSIDLDSGALKGLKGIKVTESNDFGDSKSDTANVVDSVPLNISPETSEVTVTPDEWDANITSKSSDEIAAWLAGKAGLTVTKSDGTAVTSDDGLKFSTGATADSLADVVTGGNTNVNISAKDSAGDASTTDATINVIRGAGVLQFGTITPLLFGGDTTMAVPSQSTLIAPGNTDGTKGYTVDISDTRAKNSPWYLSAEATSLTDGNGHTLSGDVVYADGKGSVTDLDDGNAVPVSSGTRSGDDTDAAKDWAQKGQQYTVAGSTTVPAGVYLKANPNIYSGSSSTTYNGTITWSLSDAPK